MLRNVVAAAFTSFDALGDSPAVCLTQNLPPEYDANLLLLGCGNVCNILFTNHAKLGTQKLDFTCCDIEPAILARNILFLSLIIEDTKNQNSLSLWEIHCNVRISSVSRSLLDAQAEKLVKYSQSLSVWNSGPYATVVRFCDSQTLAAVTAVWFGYSRKDQTQDALEAANVACENAFEAAVRTRKDPSIGKEIWLGTLRSTAPARLWGTQDLAALDEEYWDKGYVQTGKEMRAANRLNPTLLFTGSGTPVLTYGSNPLLGFHLAATYVPVQNSSLAEREASNSKAKAVIVAQAELRAWCTAFRTAVMRKSIVIRCHVGDALTFAHTLHSLGGSGSKSAGLYGNPRAFTPVLLDSRDYDRPSGSAPVLYNVIDTSDLADTLGPLNVLLATASLLWDDPSSTILTCISFTHGTDFKSALDRVLCGDFTTMSLLLGLAVVETWTNATSFSDGTDQASLEFINNPYGSSKRTSDNSRLWMHMPWKRCSAHLSSNINILPNELAKSLHCTYKAMLTKDDMHLSKIMMSLNISAPTKPTNPYYNQASFVVLLKFLQHRIETDWKKTLESLLTSIRNDKAFPMGRDFLQELIAYMHIANLHTDDSLSQVSGVILNRKLHDILASWQAVPNLVAVTIEIPREKVEELMFPRSGKNGIPALCCSLQPAQETVSQWHHRFGVVQVAFGSVTRETPTGSDGANIKVNEEDVSSSASTSLVVSFYVPTWILLQQEKSVCIAVELQWRPHARFMLIAKPGLEYGFQLFKAEIDDPRVYISRYMPSQDRHPIIAPTTEKQVSGCTSSLHISRITLTAGFDTPETKVSGITAKIDVQNAAKEQLAGQSTPVRIEQVSANELKLSIGTKFSHIQAFPQPISAARSKLRIARKSSYVEIIAPFSSPLQNDKVETFVYTMAMSSNDANSPKSPVALNIHTVNLDICLIVDVSKLGDENWLKLHFISMFSSREWAQREQLITTLAKDVRLHFKEVLFQIFRSCTGLVLEGGPIFGLREDVSGVMDTLIFVSAVKLDLNDRLLLLDAAMISLRPAIRNNPLIANILERLESMSPPILSMIDCSDTELIIWKSIFPALAERCRTWKHKAKTCEYQKHGSVPIPGGLKLNNSPICSCGIGQLPKDFMKDVKHQIPGLDQALKGYATRIAISPVFHVPYVEACVKVRDVMSFAHIDEACIMCGRKEASTAGSSSSALLRCARCKLVKYCSKECQKRDWKDHKPHCQ